VHSATGEMRCLRRLFGQDRKPHRPKALVAPGLDTIGGRVAALHTTINSPVAEIGHVMPQAATVSARSFDVPVSKMLDHYGWQMLIRQFD
jgi:hypothetical protein